MQAAYRIVTRKGAAHHHPVLVLDLENRLHAPLTIFAKEAVKRSSSGTARACLNAAVPFFNWLETDDWQRDVDRRRNDAPEQIRQPVQDYVVERLQCQVKAAEATEVVGGRRRRARCEGRD